MKPIQPDFSITTGPTRSQPLPALMLMRAGSRHAALALLAKTGLHRLDGIGHGQTASHVLVAEQQRHRWSLTPDYGRAIERRRHPRRVTSKPQRTSGSRTARIWLSPIFITGWRIGPPL